MKNIAIILLLLIYGFTTIGATVHLHYCMNEFVGWSLWHGNKDKKCDKCGMKERKDGCCKDEHKQVKLSSDQNHNQAKISVLQHFFVPVILTHHWIYNFTQPSLAIALPKSNAPPPKNGVSIYILNNVFRI